MQSQTITFKDLLDTRIEIDGLEFEATVYAVVSRRPGHLDKNKFYYEIESFDVGDIYVSTDRFSILLDQNNFRARNRRLYDMFVNQCELEALRQAAAATDEMYDKEIEYAAI